MAKTSVRVPEFIPSEPELLSPAVKQVLRVVLAVGSIAMLVGFAVAAVIALI